MTDEQEQPSYWLVASHQDGPTEGAFEVDSQSGKEEIPLPEGYYLEEEEPDFLILRRRDGSVVGMFAFPDATPETIGKAAENDARARGG